MFTSFPFLFSSLPTTQTPIQENIQSCLQPEKKQQNHHIFENPTATQTSLILADIYQLARLRNITGFSHTSTLPLCKYPENLPRL